MKPDNIEDDLGFMIVYRNQEPFEGSCSSHGTDLKDTIRYWMGKSPGIYRSEIEKIICFPKGVIRDCTAILEELDSEQYKREQEYRKRAEREEYERLKKKYEGE